MNRAWLALGAGGLAQAVLFAARPMTTYRALELGADEFVVGAVAAAFGLAPIGLAIPVGRGIDRGHELRLLRAGAVVTALAVVGLIAGTTLWHLVVANLLLGGGIVTTAVSAQGLLARFAADAELDGIFAGFTIAASIGQVIGPIAASTVADGGANVSDARLGLVVALLFAASGVALTVVARASPGAGPSLTPDNSPDPTPIVTLMRSPGILRPIVASLALLAALDVFTAFLPLVAERRQVGVSAVGVLLGARGIASIASRVFVARLTLRLGRAPVLALSMLASALLLVVLPFMTTFAAMFVVTVMLGASLGFGQPLTMSLVAASVSSSIRATALSLRMTCNRIGQLAVPLGAGAMSVAFGLPGAFALVGGLLGAAAAGLRVPHGRHRPGGEGAT